VFFLYSAAALVSDAACAMTEHDTTNQAHG